MRTYEKVLLAVSLLAGAPLLVWATGHVTATYFEATSATSTSSFAGSIAAETSGFVYDANTNNIGIGTNTPGTPLEIVRSSYPQVQIRADSTTSRVRLHAGPSGSANTIVEFWKDSTPSKAVAVGMSDLGSASLTDDLVFSTFNGSAWSERARITNGGLLGVGKNNPATALDVNGLVRAYQTGTTTCSSTIEGSLYYNATNKHFYGCDGTSWRQMD